MQSQLLSIVANVCQAAIAPICLCAYLPQWRALLRERSSAQVSLRTYGIWAVGACFEVFYAATQTLLYGTGNVLLITSILTLVFLVATIALILKFRPKRRVGECAAMLCPTDSAEEAVGAIRSLHECTDAVYPQSTGPRRTAPISTNHAI